MTSTDHLIPDETDISVRAMLSAFPEHIFPVNAEKNSLLDHLVPGWRRNADIAIVDFRSENIVKPNLNSSKPLLFIYGRIASPIANGHRISIKVDNSQGTILYKDPYGHRAPASVAKWIKKEFPGFTYRECPISQQKDDISCTWISFANIVAGLEGKDIDPHVQKNLDYFKYKVLQAARIVWPNVKQTPGMGNSSDPIEFACFQHLKAHEEKPKKRFIIHGEDLATASTKPETPKTFILREASSPQPTRFQAFFQRFDPRPKFRHFSKT